jgi:raffinose/stachyose/melibiose transport system permease protein
VSWRIPPSGFQNSKSIMLNADKRKWTNYLFIAPILILFLTFTIYPIIYNFIISFHEWSGVGSDKLFVGFRNYQTLFEGRILKKILSNFVVFAITTIVIQAFLGIIFASLFYNNIRGSNTFRILFYLPAVVTSTVVGQVFSKFFEANNGYLNNFLSMIGLGSLRRTWLADPSLALGCVSFVNIWQWTGYSMLLYYAGMLNINRDVYEAAEIDGANKFQQFIRITFPLLRGTHFTLFILGMLGSLKCFDIVFVLTDGGPNYATEMFSTYIQRLSFSLFKQGESSAVVVIMFMIAMMITAVQLYFYYQGDDRRKMRR